MKMSVEELAATDWVQKFDPPVRALMAALKRVHGVRPSIPEACPDDTWCVDLVIDPDEPSWGSLRLLTWVERAIPEVTLRHEYTGSSWDAGNVLFKLWGYEATADANSVAALIELDRPEYSTRPVQT